MDKDTHMLFESYRTVHNENMPYPIFAKLSKHATKKSDKEKSSEDFKEQMPDSKEEYDNLKDENEEKGDLKRRKDNESRWMSVLGKFFRSEYRREGIDPYVEFFEYYSPYYEDGVLRKFSEMFNNTWASKPEDKIDIDHFIKVKNELRDKKDADNEQRRVSAEAEERRLDPKCWKGYHKQGTKLKGGKRVNNCVKNS